MKVLLIHNYYANRGGEDAVFEKELELLRSKNIDVVTYVKYNTVYKKLIDQLNMAFKMIWSEKIYDELIELIKKEKPDIAHFHNIWYNISPSAYYACKKLDVPVVQTLHNFRIFCANGLLFRNSSICDKCLTNSPFYGVYYGCYRNSKIKTIPISLAENLHRMLGTWNNKINAYISLTEFSRRIFIEYGIPENKIFVKPNFLFNIPETIDYNYDYFLFVGRLSKEKGLMELLQAYKLLQERGQFFPLKIIGDGPLFADIKNFIVNNSLKNVELLGQLDEKSIIKYMENALALVIPSIWYEMFPLVILEAYRCKKAVIVPRFGAFNYTVDDLNTGIFFEFGNVNDLADKMDWAIFNLEQVKNMGLRARKIFEERYTADKNFEYLMNIYKKVISNN